MDPWLRVESRSVDGPILGLEFKLNGLDRVTPFRSLLPVASYTLELPAQWRDESGLWTFGSWEDGSTNRIRAVNFTGDLLCTATYTKTQPGVGPEPPQRKYQTAVGFVRLTKVLGEIEEERDYAAVLAQSQVAFFQEKVKAVLDREGTYADMHPQYLAYAEALDKSQKELDWLVDLIREHQILRDRFERRGLDPGILDAIDQLVIYRTGNK